VKRLLTALTALVVLLAGCSSSGSKSGKSGSAGALSGSISVDAASSLTEAFDTLESQFEAAHPGVKVKITYGASSDLATQITQGAPVDVFASASTKNMTQIGSTALEPTNFVSNTLEIAIPPSNPGNVTSVTDLAKPGVKVAVCDPAVPCGVVATQVFKNAKITVTPKASLPDVKHTLADVESGEVDAGLVYVTDVRSAGAKVKGVMIPSDVNANTVYPIAALKSARNSAVAAAFVAYVLSADGQQVLAADGFSKP
jgi:molybdate transport system substrate-binding protein